MPNVRTLSPLSPLSPLSLLWLGLAACATDPGDPAGPEIAVRGPTGPVDGTSFTCTDHPVDVLTPCDRRGLLVTGTSFVDRDGGVELRLTRSSNAADGGSVIALIDLTYGAPALRASARQVGEFEIETTRYDQDARAGWIEPVVEPRAPASRHTGRFSLTFDWGTMSGTYDTASP